MAENPTVPEEKILQGIPVSPGICIAPIHVVARGFLPPEIYPVTDVEAEKARFLAAVERTKEQIRQLQQRINAVADSHDGSIFDAHLMMLEDPAIIDHVLAMIEQRRQNAEYSLYATAQNHLEALRRVPDAYLRERASDIEDVCQRVLRNFTAEGAPRETQDPARHILVAYDIHPSDAAAMDHQSLCGFATELGSPYSHAAILARSLGIPAVVGLDSAVPTLQALSPAIIDGYTGKLIVHPSPETLAHYEHHQEQKERARAESSPCEPVTIDGERISISANIEFAGEIEQVKRSGASGVGLYRSEFLLLTGRRMPNEIEQAEVYTRLAKALAPERLVIRTLDSGGDKLAVEKLVESEPNPFLGWRGIRVSLDRPEIFKEQLRAILRASASGRVAVMFPLISGITEVLQAKELLREAMAELEAAQVSYDKEIEIGVMIELPSAAIIADLIAPEVDFFSIGTNDLTQYTVAADRVNSRVVGLYRPSHPAVVRLIKTTVEAARRHKIRTEVCGEIAGDPHFTPLLLGLGVRELSVAPHLVPTITEAVSRLSCADCESMAETALQTPTSGGVMDLALSLARRSYPELLGEASGHLP